MTKTQGSGGGQIVSVLAFYSYDTSLNLGDTYIFYPLELFEKQQINVKEAGDSPFKRKRNERPSGFNFLKSFALALSDLVTTNFMPSTRECSVISCGIGRIRECEIRLTRSVRCVHYQYKSVQKRGPDKGSRVFFLFQQS